MPNSARMNRKQRRLDKTIKFHVTGEQFRIMQRLAQADTTGVPISVHDWARIAALRAMAVAERSLNNAA